MIELTGSHPQPGLHSSFCSLHLSPSREPHDNYVRRQRLRRSSAEHDESSKMAAQCNSKCMTCQNLPDIAHEKKSRHDLRNVHSEVESMQFNPRDISKYFTPQSSLASWMLQNTEMDRLRRGTLILILGTPQRFCSSTNYLGCIERLGLTKTITLRKIDLYCFNQRRTGLTIRTEWLFKHLSRIGAFADTTFSSYLSSICRWDGMV